MTRRYYCLGLLLMSLVTATLRAQGRWDDRTSDTWTNTEYNTTEGTEFWVTFMRNSGSSGQDNKDMFLYLYATAREDAEVTVTNPHSYENPVVFNVRAGKQDSCLVPNNWGYIENDKEVSNFGIKVTSTKPIALYATNQHSSGKYDATNILPTTALMGEYVIQTYRIDQYSTEFAIVATRNQSVTIKLQKTTIDIQEYENNGKEVVTSSQTETITRNMYAGQTYLYRSASDDGGTTSNRATTLTGTTICSDYPLSVFVGGQSAKIPSDPENHIFSQQYPTDKWGKNFYVTPTYGMVYDYVQFTACKNNTEIRRNGTLIATIQAKQSYIDTVKSELYFASATDIVNQNVTYTPNVVQYTTSEVAECFLYGTSNTANHPSFEGAELSTTNTNYGAPVLTPIIPQELAMRSTMFATFTKTNTALKHYVNIVTPTTEVGGMRLDNTDISGQFHAIPNSTYSYAMIEVGNKAHKLENVWGHVNSTFTARVYGMGQSSSSKESYAYAVGSRVSRKTDMLINNRYIKEITICEKQSLNFTGLIEGEYSSYNWDFKDEGGTTTGSGLNVTHQFGGAGDYEVEFIVERPFPYLCDGGNESSGNHVEDHATVIVHVKDRYNATFHKKICEGEAITLSGRDENGNIQEYTYDSNYSEYKHFYTAAGCDSIVDVKIEVGHPQTSESYETACESYTWHGEKYTNSGRKEYVYQNEYGCTSTEYLNLTILQPVTGPTIPKTICANSTYEWNGLEITEEGTYTAQLEAANGCDSIVTLEVKIEDAYLEEISETLCFGATYPWRGKELTEAKTYTETASSPNGCDSTFILHLDFYPDYSNIQLSIETCADKPYKFGDDLLKESGTYTKSFTTDSGCDSTVTLTLTVWPVEADTLRETICAGESYMFDDQEVSTGGEYKKTEMNEHGCAKATVLYLTVNPRSEYLDTIRICEEALPYTYAGKYVAERAGDYEQRLDEKNQYGCDSIYHLHLIVEETIVTPIYLERCETEGPYNHPDERAVKLQNLTQTNVYRDTLQTVTGCDSIIELHLDVWPTYEVDERQTICDYEELDFHGHVFKDLIAQADPYRFDTTLFSIHGCDSLVHLYLTVYPSYKIPTETKTVCQDKEHPVWEWRDEDGTLHGTVSIAEPGEVFLADTLKTVEGCDSIFGVQVRIIPSYRFDSLYSVCQDGRITWQGKSFCGDKAVPQSGDQVLAPGVYRDTIILHTGEGCDSIFYLQLHVNPIYDTDINMIVCDNEKEHSFDLSDTQGTVINDDLPFTTYPSEEGVLKPTQYINRDYTLQTIHGCDSVVHLHLTVHPTYEFVTKVKICASENYKWRDKMYYVTGTYYDSLQTVNGCDSVYVLELFKKPMLLVPMYDTICDNETYQHKDTLWYTNGSYSLVETMVWTPGMTIPQTYSDVVFRSQDDGCDSVVYRYYLQINKTYTFPHTATICSNQSVETDEHTYTGYEFELEPGMYRAPFDTIFYDRYSTVQGCDSVYELHATVYPAYRHCDTIMICDDATAIWRDHQYSNMEAGEYSFFDSYQTVLSCDSVYELKLIVHPTYLFEQYVDKCADEDMTWHDYNLDHLPVGDHFFYDSLTTASFGCDSVYHLYLTVKDTTNEFRHDTICRTEIYDFHGKSITEAGYYHDTTLNAWGCHHFTYLYLAVIEPTVPTAWADSICADDDAYDLFYTYTGDFDPIAYSVYYDEEGHANGFEDIIGQAITTPDELSWLRIPMPNVREDRTKYPKPNYYTIRFVLDNGICTDPNLCSTDTSIVLSYPSWITRQRFGDVIALYNEKYNGGYRWSNFQWYHGDTLLVGENHEYLYVPTGLVVGDEYHVRLIREGEMQDFQTCPITVIADPINNDFAPELGYLSVVPTCVCPGHPYVNILSRKDGTYRITNMAGLFVKEGIFNADATEVEVPPIEGAMYIVQLWSYDTPEEPYRAIKIMVKPECCTEHYENIPF